MDENKTKTQKQTSEQTERDWKEGDRSARTGTVDVFGGETETVTDKNRFFFFLRIYKPPQGCFIERPTPPYLQKGNKNKKGTKVTLTIYKVSGN